MWTRLRRRALAGFKFRRQHPVGSYVLDFYCAQVKLAVEVDGMSHDHPDRMLHDQRRTDWLAREGIAVLRVSAEAVRVSLDEVLQRIQRGAEARVRG